MDLNQLFPEERPFSLTEVDFSESLRILVLAPHPDDFDAIGVTLRHFHENGNPINLAVVSESPAGVEDSYAENHPGKSKSKIREEEQIASCQFFGLSENDYQFLRIHEDESGALIEDEASLEVFQKLFAAQNPDMIFLPHGNDSNQGHVRNYSMARKVVESSGRKVAMFLNCDPKTIELRYDMFTAFGDDEAAWKGELLRFHDSQHQRNFRVRNFGFDERILGNNREIAVDLPGNHKYAEVFEIELI